MGCHTAFQIPSRALPKIEQQTLDTAHGTTKDLSKYPKKKPDAWRRDEATTTCLPDIRIPEELWAFANPHKTATVPRAVMGGSKGGAILTRLWKYWFWDMHQPVQEEAQPASIATAYVKATRLYRCMIFFDTFMVINLLFFIISFND